MKVNGVLAAMRTSMSGLSHNMKRMELISENIANAEKTPDAKGQVYLRQDLVNKNQNRPASKRFGELVTLKMRQEDNHHMASLDPSGTVGPNGAERLDQYKVIEEKGEKLVYNPDHPMADERGFVRMPDINPVEEMVDLIAASRSYEANVTVINAAKDMAKRSMEI